MSCSLKSFFLVLLGPLLYEYNDKLHLVGIVRSSIPKSDGDYKFTCASGLIFTFTALYPYLSFIRYHTENQVCLTNPPDHIKKREKVEPVNQLSKYNRLYVFVIGIVLVILGLNVFYIKLRAKVNFESTTTQ